MPSMLNVSYSSGWKKRIQCFSVFSSHIIKDVSNKVAGATDERMHQRQFKNESGGDVCYNCNEVRHFVRECPRMETEEVEFQQLQFTQRQRFTVTNPRGQDSTRWDWGEGRMWSISKVFFFCNLEQNPMLPSIYVEERLKFVLTHVPHTH